MKETKVPENRAYKVTLILLLGLAAFSTAMKELNRVHYMVSSVHEFTRQLRGTDVVRPNEKPISTPETTIQLCSNDILPVINSSAESGSGLMAAATDGNVDSMDNEAIACPELGAKVDLFAGKRTNRNVPQLARARYASPGRSIEEIASIRLDGNRPPRFEYKTHDRTVTVELPMSMITDSKADAFDSEVSTDVVLGLLGKLDRKQSHTKTETRRRELMIKRFERNIGSRRAS